MVALKQGIGRLMMLPHLYAAQVLIFELYLLVHFVDDSAYRIKTNECNRRYIQPAQKN